MVTGETEPPPIPTNVTSVQTKTMTILCSPEETPLTGEDISIILHFLARCSNEIEGTNNLDWEDPNSENGKLTLHQIKKVHKELSMIRHRSHSTRKYWKIVPAR